MTFTAAVLGASGYAGGELVRLLDDHPSIEVAYLGAHSQAGRRLREVHPNLGRGDRILRSHDLSAVAGADLVFLALPHGASADIGAELTQRGQRVVDLGSDYRLDSPARYERAYGSTHRYPEALPAWTYGLPELFGDEIRQASAVAAPGCYPTGTLLAVAPLLDAGMIRADGIVVNALSGVSGAGRSLREDLLYGAVDEGVRAYAVTTHRHRPEIEMALESFTGVEGLAVTFTPHLVPMQRGILATCTAPVADGVTDEDLRSAQDAFAKDRPFVEVIDGPPQTRSVVGSNRVAVAAFVDRSTNTAIVMSAIDNLIKGAAGQAIQAANLMLGVLEPTGLPWAGWMP